jgi:gamma-glutamyltranspeptidase/glutathione hydrolase
MGGNAIDAAVAVGYAQAVVNSCCGNIGGGGFMTIHLADGRDTFINFREKAPAAASADMYLDASGKPIPGASLHGYLAVGVPGTVAGLDAAQRKYGKLTRAQVMAPAIKLAREGFILTRGDTDILDTTVAFFKKDPEAARIFLRADGSALQPGDRLVQKDLAVTLQAIARRGPDAFYKGAIPAAVERAAKQGGGIITAADFAAYTITETAPLTCTYRSYTFVSAPPPSSGGVTMCQILNTLEGYDMKAMGFQSAASIHVMTEAMRHAYMDRNTFLGDPDFVKNPLGRLLSKSYAAAIREKISADRATPSEQVQPGAEPHEKPETTHYSVVDKAGNAVSTTYTVNGRFGAVVIAPGTGFFLNDEMDDFTVKIGSKNMYGLVQGASNAIAPGKRPLSSMAPTLVTRDGKTFMVVGSPGGSRIITITLQAALNVIDYGMAPQEAVDAARMHHQWLPDTVYYETRGISPDTLNVLHTMGYKTSEQTPWGATELILIGLPDAAGVSGSASSGNDSGVSGRVLPGYIYGANDSRRPAGAAIGY